MDQNYNFNAYTATGVASAKKKPIAAIIAAVVAVAALGAGSAYAFVPSVKNSVNKTFMKPDKYLQSVYTKNIEKFSDEAKDSYEATLKNVDAEKGSGCSFDLTAELGSLAKNAFTQMGETGCSTISLKGDMSVKGQNFGSTANLSADGKSIVTINTFVDSTSAYLQAPELTESYLKFNMDELSGGMVSTEAFTSALDMSSLMSADELKSTILKYSKLVINELDEVEKGAAIDIGDDKCDVYKVKLTQADSVNLVKNMVTELKNDTVIKNMLTKNGLSESDYNTALSELEVSINEAATAPDDGKSYVTYDTYIDKKGAVRGFNVEVIVDGTSEGKMSLTCAEEGKKDTITMTATSGAETATFVIESTEKDGKYTGTAAISGGDVKLALNFTDLEVVDDQYINGKLSMNLKEFSPDSPITELVLNFSTDGKSQTVACDIPTIVNLKFTVAEKECGELVAPTGKTYSQDEISTGYAAEIDLEKFMNDACAAIGIKAETIGALFMPSSMGSLGTSDDIIGGTDGEDSSFDFGDTDLDFENMTEEELQAYFDSYQ